MENENLTDRVEKITTKLKENFDKARYLKC